MMSALNETNSSNHLETIFRSQLLLRFLKLLEFFLIVPNDLTGMLMCTI